MGSKGSAHKDHFTQKKRYPLPSFHVVGKESGVSIFATQDGDTAVRFDKSAPLAKAEAVDGVEGAFLIRGVLSSSECEQFMQLTEAMGFDEALVSTGHGMVKMTGLRNNKRVIWQLPQQDQSRLLQTVWARVKPFLPRDNATAAPCEKMCKTSSAPTRSGFFPRTSYSLPKTAPCGLNERLRFYRYAKGQRFRWHYDGCFPRRDGSGECSELTLIVYLNDGYKGGVTAFRTGRCCERVRPEQGMALLFWHGRHHLSPEHEGSELFSGNKYVLRTDVMFRPITPPGKPSKSNSAGAPPALCAESNRGKSKERSEKCNITLPVFEETGKKSAQ